MKHKIEGLLQLIRKFNNYPVIVEGLKDKKALSRLGFTKVYTMNRAVYKLTEDISKHHRTVLILTDLDTPGKKKYGEIKRNLSRLGINVNDTLRNYLFRQTKLRQIEGIDSYIERFLNE
ncbi:hypothetical protein DRJ17_01890 [Candidatus Woesearchaeota archaeon]|nr:MAG: hypothetical protein DRJ17_01890 [Candidatus Woesearchaeota archaeon]